MKSTHGVDKRVSAGVVISPFLRGACDLVAKSEELAGSLGRLIIRAVPSEALAHPVAWSSWTPLANKLIVGALGLLSDRYLSSSGGLVIVGIGWPALVSFPNRLSRLRFKAALLIGHQGWTYPEIVALLVSRSQHRTASLRSTATAATW